MRQVTEENIAFYFTFKGDEGEKKNDEIRSNGVLTKQMFTQTKKRVQFRAAAADSFSN